MTKTNFVLVTETIDLDKVREETLLFSGSFNVPNTTSEPASNITLGDTYLNYDEIFFVLDGGDISSSMVSSTANAVISVNSTLAETEDKVRKFKVDIKSATAMTVWFARDITYGPTYANVATTNITIEQIYGIKY